MSTWHNSGCRKPDVVSVDDIPVCKSCGSACIRQQPTDARELRVVVSRGQEGPSELKLAWPSTITFSQLESLPEGSEIRLRLEQLTMLRGRNSPHGEGFQDLPLNENTCVNIIRHRNGQIVDHHELDTQNTPSFQSLYNYGFDAEDDRFVESLENDLRNGVSDLVDILEMDLKNISRRDVDETLRRSQRSVKGNNPNRCRFPPMSGPRMKYQSMLTQAPTSMSRLAKSHAPPIHPLNRRVDRRNSNSEDQCLTLSRMYKDLEGKDQIRLLYLSPEDAGHGMVPRERALHGYLKHVSLADRPGFIAVSYTWASKGGDRKASKTIFLGDSWEPLAITRNCADALRQLRHATETRAVWIDAVCINQLNGVEKTHQVGIMRDIYSSAELVKIYLGWDGVYRKHGLRRVRDSLFCDGNTARLTQADYDDVEALFERPYWSRIWVVQEVFLSKEAVVLIGDSSIPLSSILRTAFCSYFPTWVSLAQGSRAGRICPLGNAESFSELLFATSFCNALDQRDRVFALLGLVQGAKLEGLVADYSQTAAEIYVGLTAYFLIKHGQFRLLKLAAIENRSSGIYDNTERRFAGERPSWVPTWDYSLRTDLNSIEQHLVKCCTNYWSTEEFIWDEVRESWVSTGKRMLRAFLENLTPASPSRRISMEGDINEDNPVPRVFQGSGALLIRAYCVLDLDMALHGGAFVADLSGAGLVLQPRVSSLGWRLHILSDSASIEREDRFVEIPGCDSFLHLKPVGRVPGAYRLASMCLIAFVADKHSDMALLLTRLENSSSCRNHRLLNRLIPFLSRDLQYLQDWMFAMRLNTWLVPARVTKNTDQLGQGLSAKEIKQYQQWLIYITQYSTSVLGQEDRPGTGELDEVLGKLSSHLDEWQEISLWQRICGLLEAVDWQQYLMFLTDMRFRLHQYFLHCSNMDNVEMSSFCEDAVESKLEGLLIDISRTLPLEDERLYFGDVTLSDAVAEVCNGNVVEACRNMTIWANETEDGIFGPWMRLEAFLRHMLHCQADSNRMLDKFTQRQVLKQLYTRWEPQDFLLY
ncbi:hypothetical protein J7T55_004073 [Diaporthe amygdali]|uniref:uncharacterized protein n=1 Tax=Phomopsis amygdali TaxID=1214568 RepID=UPI0022FF1EE4|nr:uncharacterized protein J7T55_004073 [Diaporthe amygdali]KAJ0115904.1 hypothetical protein J7T55_004073 [Diaporthe amygdali]